MGMGDMGVVEGLRFFFFVGIFHGVTSYGCEMVITNGYIIWYNHGYANTTPSSKRT